MVPANKLLAVTYKITGPGIPVTSPADATTKFEQIVSQVIGVLTIVGVIYFIVQIILAGYAFMAAQGEQKNLETARDRLTQGVLGLTIVIVAVGAGTLVAKLAGLNNPLDINQMFKSLGL